MEELQRRQDRLERANRRLRVVGLLVIAAFAAIILMGQARPPTVIEAQAFILRDKTGLVLGGLGVGDDGFPYLELLDRNGVNRMTHIVGEANSFIFLRDHQSNILMETIIYDTSGAAIAMRGSGTAPQILLQAPGTVDPFIYLRGLSGNIVWQAP